MAPRMFVLFWWITVGVLVVPAPGLSAEGQAAHEKPGRWWLRNPLSYEVPPEGFLTHVEGTFNYNFDDGNLIREKIDFFGALANRYDRFSNYFRYTLDRRDASRPGDPPIILRDSKKQVVHDDFRIALTDKLYTGPGIRWEADNYVELEERYRYYLGIGGNLISRELVKMKVFAAYGRQEQEYTFDSALGVSPALSDIIYMDESLTVFLSESMMVTQWFNVSVDTDDSDKYLYSLEVVLDFKVAENIFCSTTYNLDYDNEPFAGIEKTDQALTVGLKFTY